MSKLNYPPLYHVSYNVFRTHLHHVLQWRTMKLPETCLNWISCREHDLSGRRFGDHPLITTKWIYKYKIKWTFKRMLIALKQSSNFDFKNNFMQIFIKLKTLWGDKLMIPKLQQQRSVLNIYRLVCAGGEGGRVEPGLRGPAQWWRRGASSS